MGTLGKAIHTGGFWFRETGQALHRLGSRLQVSRHQTVMNIFNKSPAVDKDAFLAPSTSVIGNVKIGRGSSIRYGCVLRGSSGLLANGFSNLISGSQILRGFNEIAKLDFSAMSGDNLGSQPRRPLRNYQVVVAATREMGIGKDGKLPWRLPSDLKFFKELTVTTSDPEKKNVVIMGRKTWESIPLENRPLPGRLNVVLTRCQSSDIMTGENVLICGSIPLALELLAEVPYCFSTEKVFVIGGGQIFTETLNAPCCEAIHITEIETRFECDTFIPSVDLSCFQPWYSSKPLVENDVRFSFATYVRVRSGATICHLNTKAKSTSSPNCNNVEVKDFTFLPRMILERRDELITK